MREAKPLGKSSKRSNRTEKVSRSDERRAANKLERHEIRKLLSDGLREGVSLENLATEKKLYKLKQEFDD